MILFFVLNQRLKARILQVCMWFHFDRHLIQNILIKWSYLFYLSFCKSGNKNVRIIEQGIIAWLKFGGEIFFFFFLFQKFFKSTFPRKKHTEKYHLRWQRIIFHWSRTHFALIMFFFYFLRSCLVKKGKGHLNKKVSCKVISHRWICVMETFLLLHVLANEKKTSQLLNPIAL